MKSLKDRILTLEQEISNVQSEVENIKNTQALEKKITVLETLVKSFMTDGPDVNLITKSGTWKIHFTLNKRTLYKKGFHNEWIPMKYTQQVLDIIFK